MVGSQTSAGCPQRGPGREGRARRGGAMRAFLGRRRASSGAGRPPRWGGGGGAGGEQDAAAAEVARSEERTQARAGATAGCEEEEEAKAPGPGGRLDRALESRLEDAQVRFLVREQFLLLPRLRYTAFRDVPVVACTFNANGRSPPKGLDLRALLQPRLSGGLVVVGLQEIVPLNVRNVVQDGMGRRGPSGERVTDAWEEIVGAALNSASPSDSVGGGGVYVRLLGHQMVGIYLSVWVHADLAPHISEERATSVGCGVLGVFGNKGSVGAWLRVHDTTLCILCAHLSSGQQTADLARRNADAQDILARMAFPDPDGPEGATVGVADADHVLLVGDLNYRLNLEDLEVRRAMAVGDWRRLRQADQLAGEMAAGRAFPGWEEGPLSFLPTYKFRRGTDEYSGDMDGLRRRGSSEALSLPPGGGGGMGEVEEAGGADEDGVTTVTEMAEQDDRDAVSDIDSSSLAGSMEGVGKREKVRTPAWCDRVLMQSSGWIDLENYGSFSEVRMSDHKPVTARLKLRARSYEDSFVHAAIAEAYRMADLIEMHHQPRLDVPEKSVDFGEMYYCRPRVRTIEMLNCGEVPAYWSLECAEGDFPPWLRVSPVSGKVAVGTTATLKLEAFVRGGRRGSTEYLFMNTMDTILILTVEGGGAVFISIDAQYKSSPFGLTMSSLVALRPPMREGAQKLLCPSPAASAPPPAEGPPAQDRNSGVPPADSSDEGAAADEDIGARAGTALAYAAGEGYAHSQEYASQEEGEERPSNSEGESDEVSVAFCGKHDVPLELQRMVTFLTHKGFPSAFVESTFTPDLLSQGLVKQSILQLVPEGAWDAGGRPLAEENSPNLKAQVAWILSQLEADAIFTEDEQPEAMLTALLLFFAEMPQPLLPDALADICRLCIPSRIGAEQLVAENLTSVSKATFYYVVDYLKGVAEAHPGLKSTICGIFSQLWIEAPAPVGGHLSAYLGTAPIPHEQCACFIDLFLDAELLAPGTRLSVANPDVLLPCVLP